MLERDTQNMIKAQVHGTPERPRKHSVRRRPSQEWYHTLLLGMGTFMSAAALMTGLVPSSRASLEVLSGMDCVIEPSALIELGSAVPGLIAASYYDRSDVVTKGTLMSELESDVERIALSIAEQVANSDIGLQLSTETAEFGERTRNRNQQLLKTSGVSRQVVDQVSTEARIANLQVLQERETKRLAQLEVLRAKATLARRQIRSPINGSVVELYKRAGEYVDSDAVYQIAQLDPLNVEVIVPVEYLRNLSTGMSAVVRIDVPGFDNDKHLAKVQRIDAVADTASATYGVRLVLENPEMKIPSGVRCTVDFLAS